MNYGIENKSETLLYVDASNKFTLEPKLVIQYTVQGKRKRKKLCRKYYTITTTNQSVPFKSIKEHERE